MSGLGSINLGFDAGSLAELVRMMGFEALLMPEITGALTKAGKLTVDTADQLSWALFQNPTGAFASSLYFWIVSPEEVAAGAGVPYAMRLEEGFSGMTDALGRYYPYWPDYHWAAQTLDTVEPEVVLLVGTGVEQAWAAIGGL